MTVAGFVLFQLGHVPKEGENFYWHDWRFEVMDMDGARINRLLLKYLVSASPFLFGCLAAAALFCGEMDLILAAQVIADPISGPPLGPKYFLRP